jgi:hypothetical protein
MGCRPQARCARTALACKPELATRRKRANLADELANLVSQIGQAPSGEGRGATAAPNPNGDVADVAGD